MDAALSETARRREKQMAYNTEHGITPKTVSKKIFDEVTESKEKVDKKQRFLYTKDGIVDADTLRREIKSLNQKMRRAAENLDFESAAEYRDAIRKMEDDLLVLE
jgi:excinuclease ABC subunit B